MSKCVPMYISTETTLPLHVNEEDASYHTGEETSMNVRWTYSHNFNSNSKNVHSVQRVRQRVMSASEPPYYSYLSRCHSSIQHEKRRKEK